MTDRREFCAALRRERERRDIALDAVAERTKINIALLAGLERGDLARWPAGIFRRAFVRAYVEAIGLHADDVLPAFARLFPEEGDDGVVNVPAFERVVTHDGLRLTLASRPRPSRRVWFLRGLGAALDLLVVAAAGFVVSWLSGAPVPASALAVCAAYVTLGTLLVEATPGWWMSRRLLKARPAIVEPDFEPLAAESATSADARRPVSDAPVRPVRRERRPARSERQWVARSSNRLQ